MKVILLSASLVCIYFAGCAAPVKIAGYPSEHARNIPKEECEYYYEHIQVLGSLPSERKYIELGYMNVKQESSSQLVSTSEEKQIEEARIKACQWGADAIVVMGSQSNKGSDFWSGWKDQRETKIIAIKYK